MLEDFIATMAKHLVEQPDNVRVGVQVEDGLTRYTLTVAKDDVGRVVGREGRTAKAMRAIVTSVAARQGKRVRLDIENID